MSAYRREHSTLLSVDDDLYETAVEALIQPRAPIAVSFALYCMNTLAEFGSIRVLCELLLRSLNHSQPLSLGRIPGL